MGRNPMYEPEVVYVPTAKNPQATVYRAVEASHEGSNPQHSSLLEHMLRSEYRVKPKE